MSRAGKIVLWVFFLGAVGWGILGYTIYRYGWEQALWWVAETVSSFVDMEASQETKELYADVQRYRKESGAMEPGKAAEEWLSLLDRARELDGAGVLWDQETKEPFGVPSVFAALPPPAAWPALRLSPM